MSSSHTEIITHTDIQDSFAYLREHYSPEQRNTLAYRYRLIVGEVTEVPRGGKSRLFIWSPPEGVTPQTS